MILCLKKELLSGLLLRISGNEMEIEALRFYILDFKFLGLFDFSFSFFGKIKRNNCASILMVN